MKDNANVIGSLWMILSMAVFAVEDAFIKAAALWLPVGEVLILFGLGGATVFALMAGLRGERLFSADLLSRSMRIRYVFEFMGRLFYMLSLALTSLSATTAILQATPIVVVMGAAIVFRERVPVSRWLAILVGLVGVLIILRPSSDAFSWLSLLAVVGMLGFAGRDLASRAAPLTLGVSTLGFHGFLTILLAGIVWTLYTGEWPVVPRADAWLLMLGGVLSGVLAYTALMKAMRTGEVSAVTPWRYSRLLFGLTLGILFFGERPDTVMVVGCVLVVLSGLSLMLPVRRRARL